VTRGCVGKGVGKQRQSEGEVAAGNSLMSPHPSFVVPIPASAHISCGNNQ